LVLSPKVTQQHVLETRARVLKAAEALFAKKGYYDTSMDDIVIHSGLSKGAIYGHFKSKEDLFVALHDAMLARTLDGLRSTFAPEDSARAKLEKAADLVFESFIGKSREQCRIALEFDVAAPRMRSLQLRNNRFDVMRDFVTEIVKEGVERGEFRSDADPQSIALILVSVADGLALEYATTTFEFDWTALKAETKKIVFEGLLPSRPGRS